MSIESFAVYRVAVSFNQRIMTSKSSFCEAGHNALIISRPFRFLFHRVWPSVKTLSVAAAELISEELMRKKRSGGSLRASEEAVRCFLQAAKQLPSLYTVKIQV